jgi:hypothetical protein
MKAIERVVFIVECCFIPTLYTMLKTYKSKIIIIRKIVHRKMPKTNLIKNLLEINFIATSITELQTF